MHSFRFARVSRTIGLSAQSAALAFALTFGSTPVWACACGCSVFDVGTSSLLPSGPGGTVYFQYAFLDQTQNRSGNNSAPGADNADKEIESSFLSAGGQYMFNDSWGVMGEVPFTERSLRTDVGGGDIASFQHGALGDIRLMGVYSGFSEDMSTGVIFGLKLPTGDHTYSGFDPDTEIGSGSTDVLLGGYHSGALTVDQSFTYFAQAVWQHEIAFQYSYQPGYELNGAAGLSYNKFQLGGGLHIAPILQFLVSDRGRDGGAAGDPVNTGYTRLLVAPAVEIDRDQWKFYADAEMPVYQHMNGDQLIAPVAFKFIMSYGF